MAYRWLLRPQKLTFVLLASALVMILACGAPATDTTTDTAATGHTGDNRRRSDRRCPTYRNPGGYNRTGGHSEVNA